MGVSFLNRPGPALLRLGLAGALIAVTAAACSLAVDLDGLEGGSPDAGLPAPDAKPPESCSHEVPPTRPGGSATGGSMVITTAVRSVDLGEASTMEDPVGLDLDKTCTCIPDEDSCRSEYSSEDHCDDSNGVDNAGAKLFKSLLAIGAEGMGSTYYTKMAEQGEWGLLLTISDYNGEANDELITVSLYPSNGTAADGSQPAWNGQDAWPVTSSGLVDNASIDQPLYIDVNAYVANNVLVAQFPELRFRFSGPNSNLSANVKDTTVMGLLELVADGLGVRVTRGVMAGHWRIEDVFGMLGTLVANGQKLCNDGGLIYEQTKGVICDFVDIAHEPPAEGEVLCNALSFGLGFETFPAKLGPVVPPKPEASLCPDGQSPATDVCED